MTRSAAREQRTRIPSLLLAIAWCSAVAASHQAAGAQTPLERALAGEVRDEIGRSYWVRGDTATNRVFCDARDFPEERCDGTLFGPQHSERFTIEAASTDAPASRARVWFRVRFDSGKAGYLSADTLRSLVFVEMRHRAASAPLTIYELFFNEQPERVIARVRRASEDRQSALAQSEQQRFERGGVRLGMTKQQVLNSSWGLPESIHLTSDVLGLREQWIYSDSELYFERGVLSAIRKTR